MAKTVALARPEAYIAYRSGPPNHPGMPSLTASGVAGDLLVQDGAQDGYLVVDNDPAAATLIGLCEQAFAAPAANGDIIVPVTLMLPNFMYVFSTDAATARTDNYTKYETKDNAIGAIIDLDGGEGGGAAWANMIGFASDFGRFRTGSFIAQAGTSQNVGALNTPLEHMGVTGDTQPRVIIMPDNEMCFCVS